jgi:hypothetical protein
MTVRGGAGIDVLDLAMVDPTGHQYRDGRAGTAVAAAGGDGADRISIRTGALTLPPDPELRLDWHVAAFGGGGDDQIDVVGRDMILTGARVALDGGDGADRLTAGFDGTGFIGAADFAVAVVGGGGADTIGFHWGVSQAGPSTLSVNLLAGAGDDELTAAVATGPDGNLVTTLRMLAGAGDDALSMDLLGGPDTVDDPNRVVLDGGTGIDAAHAPPGAVVRNCEQRL